MSPVTLERRGDVALVTIDNPPVNALSRAVRVGLVDAAKTIAADAEIRGALLLCAGRTFVAGADITEFDRPPEAPSLRDSFAALEEADKPVVAALHGTALGGGLELALSCHYRVIDPAGVVGLPEVSLGIIPGAGGTQRLPRLIGLTAALDLITTGRRVGAAEALRLGIADAVTEGDGPDFALGFLRGRLDAPVPRVSNRDFPTADPTALAAARAAAAAAAPGQVAPLSAVDVLADSAGLDFPAGELLEQAAFEALRVSPQSAALRHVFFAERAAGKVPDLGAPRPLRTIGVLGGGDLGSGIAAASLRAGYAVRVLERDAAACAGVRDRVAAILREGGARAVDATKATADDGLVISDQDGVLGEADLIVEAASDSVEVTREVFGSLDRLVKAGAVLATGVAVPFGVSAVAAGSTRSADVIGLHVRARVRVVTLLEVVVPSGASPDAVATGFAFGKALGVPTVRADDRVGPIGSRLLSAFRRAADVMVERGAGAGDVDAVLDAFGLDRDGRGEGGSASDPRAGPSRTFTAEVIRDGLLHAVAEDGAKLLEEGGALRAGDIDVVAVDGYGFPRWQGGPMHAAEARRG